MNKRGKSAAEATDFFYICCAFRLFFVSLIFTLKRMIRNGHRGIFLHKIVMYSGYNGRKSTFLYVKYKNFRNSSPCAPARKKHFLQQVLFSCKYTHHMGRNRWLFRRRVIPFYYSWFLENTTFPCQQGILQENISKFKTHSESQKIIGVIPCFVLMINTCVRNRPQP